MKLSSFFIANFVINFKDAPQTVSAFCPRVRTISPSVSMRGYLDDLTADLNAPDPNPDTENDSREANVMSKDKIDRAGPGDWNSYVEFNEFDGGDGQMGVAGDGSKGLDKFDMSEMAKSKSMSAKNSWGSSTGYADTLVAQGVDTARAQQLENWHNQQEILGKRREQRSMTEDFDSVTTEDENWRNLAKFGVERNQDFDLSETFGAVTTSEQIEGVIELKGQMNAGFAVHEFGLKNPYMGFADFRAAFTPETPSVFTVEPTEGSLRQKEETVFNVKFKAQQPGTAEGYLIVETEDFKKTWKVVGRTG